MLLQTNSYIVPKEKRAAHNHLMQRFRQVLMKIGCDHFEVYEQVGANWAGGETSGRFVQMMKFRDRKHCQAVQLMERKDPAAQALVREFCNLINFNYQEQQGLFAHGYYQATIDPIRLHRPGELSYHAFPGDEASFDPHAATAPLPLPPPLPMPTADAPRSDETSDAEQGQSMSNLVRKPAEGESDPAGDELLGIEDPVTDTADTSASTGADDEVVVEERDPADDAEVDKNPIAEQKGTGRRRNRRSKKRS